MVSAISSEKDKSAVHFQRMMYLKQIDALKEAIISQKQAISEQQNLIEMYKKRLGISITGTQTNNQYRNQSIIPLIRRLQ